MSPVFFCLVLTSLFPQEGTEGDDDFLGGEIPLLENREGITVTASPETTQQVKTITREEIENTHAPDLAVLLQETLDLGVTRYGPYGNQTAVNMRGFDSQRIAFLINGVPVNSPATGDFDISLVDLSSVDRIEVVYGGSDSKYNVSGSLGGVINIITLKKEAPGLRIGGSMANTAALPGKYYKPRSGDQGPQWQDLIDTQNITLSLGYGSEKSSWSGGLFTNRAGNHFLFKDYYGRTLRRESNEVWDAGGGLSYIRDLPDETKLIIGGDLYYGDKNIPLSGTSDIGEKQRDFSIRQNLMVDMPRAFRDELSAEASLSHAWSVREYAASSRHDQQVVTAVNRWSWYPRDWLTLRLGGDYRYAFLDSTDMGRHDRHDGGLYATAEFQPARRVLVIPSIKTVFPGGEAVPVVPVPKLGFVWTPTDSFTLKNNYFRSFKLPDFEDLYWKGGGMYGNPDLKSEDGWGADLGAAYRPHDRIDLEGFFFTQWTADSIHWYPSGAVWKPVNVGEAIFFGLDAKLRCTVPLSRGPFEKIGLSFSYQYLLSYLLSYGYTYASDKRLPYMPQHTVGFFLTLPWERGFRGYRGSLTFSGHYEGRRYADTVNLTGLKPYVLVNANLNQGIGKNISGFAVLRNILNQSYESFDDYYMPGLTITVGIRFSGSGSRVSAAAKGDP